MSSPHSTLTTARLLLQAPATEQTAAVVAFYARNAAYFAPWDPPMPADFNQTPVVRQRLADARVAFDGGVALRWWLSPRAAPGTVIGSVHLSNIVRLAFQSCQLGYALDQAHTGAGLMHEALQAVLGVAFGPVVNLHRVQAAVRPENRRSLAVLARLGFAQEGLARQYLYIDGAWRDHLLLATTHAGFQAPAHWPVAPSASG
jgi:ribosomal-protein-alanine N-acetyltransferase